MVGRECSRRVPAQRLEMGEVPSPATALDRVRAGSGAQPVQSICQIGSMLTVRSPQSVQRNRCSNSLNASMSAAPCNSFEPSSRVFPHVRQRQRVLISKSRGGEGRGRIDSLSRDLRFALRRVAVEKGAFCYRLLTLCLPNRPSENVVST